MLHSIALLPRLLCDHGDAAFVVVDVVVEGVRA